MGGAMRKVFIESSRGNCAYAKMLEEFGFEFSSYLGEVDLVCFTGGADVDPLLYDTHKHPTTFPNTERDEHCLELFDSATNLGIPMLGICRGSQFLCVANGGKLWQDVDMHTQSHMALSTDGEVLAVTSTHHQEMRPVGGRILMIANTGNYRSTVSDDGTQRTVPAVTPTIESVYWEDTNSLSIQGHPEFNNASPQFKEWTRKHILKLLMKEEI